MYWRSRRFLLNAKFSHRSAAAFARRMSLRCIYYNPKRRQSAPFGRVVVVFRPPLVSISAPARSVRVRRKLRHATAPCTTAAQNGRVTPVPSPPAPATPTRPNINSPPPARTAPPADPDPSPRGSGDRISYGAHVRIYVPRVHGGGPEEHKGVASTGLLWRVRRSRIVKSKTSAAVTPVPRPGRTVEINENREKNQNYFPAYLRRPGFV